MVEDDMGERRWIFRDAQERVVREYLEQNKAWKHERDFIYAPTGLVATVNRNGIVRYFHVDHLGTCSPGLTARNSAVTTLLLWW